MPARVVTVLAAALLAGSALPAPWSSAQANPPRVGCSWLGESDPRDVNVGAPDIDVDYYYAPLDGLGGNRIDITGTYPHARYFSFTLYGSAQNALDSLYDSRIRPDPGSDNPFATAVAPAAATTYTLHVLFQTPPRRPAPNTIYARPNSVGFLVFRIYVPRDRASRSAGVPWPVVHVLDRAGRPEFDEGACASIAALGGAAVWQGLARADRPAALASPADGTAPVPRWTRSFDNDFGNQQAAYLQTLISRHWGPVAVVRFRAPSHPDTDSGAPVYGDYDVRYWSVCSYDRSGTAVYDCLPDFRAHPVGGWVTLVVSDPAHRPRNADDAHGVSWLAWGPADTIQLVERNLLPAPSFRGAAQRIDTPAQNPDAADIMGDFYPATVYCSTLAFERGGPDACSR